MGLIGIILAVIFFASTVVLAIRLTKRKKPVWAYVTTKIIGLGTDTPTELKLVFDGKSVLEVYRTLLIFFNRGNETIRKNEVTDAIQIRFKEAELLRDAIPMIVNKTQTRVDIVPRSNDKFEVDFFYLDHNDGVVIEALHTKYEKIECDGNIIGTGTPKYIGKFEYQRSKHLLRPLAVSTSLFIIGLGIFFAMILGLEYTVETIVTRSFLPAVMLGFLLGLLMYIVAQCKYIWPVIRFPKWSQFTIDE